MPDYLSCVVVNYHTPDDLHRFVNSWLMQDLEETELFIVDVQPTDTESRETSDWLGPMMQLYNIQYWPMDYNCGYSGGCNFAGNLATGNVLAFFNADTVLHHDTLGKCYHALTENEGWGILGPLQYDSQGRVTAGGIFGPNAHPKHRGWRARDVSPFRDVRDDATTVAGSAFFITREAWEACANDPEFKSLFPAAQGGAFLPTPHYYEETWLSYFARSKGFKCVYYGEAEMIHEWHKASSVGGKTEKEYKPKSQQMFRRACDHFGIERD